MAAPDPDDLAAVITWLNRLRLSQPAVLHRRLNALEELMALTEDQIAAITANLENIRADIQRLNDGLVAVQQELANVDPATAAKLQPLVDLSAQIAAATPEPPTP